MSAKYGPIYLRIHGKTGCRSEGGTQGVDSYMQTKYGSDV